MNIKTILIALLSIILSGCAARSIYDFSHEELLSSIAIDQSEFSNSITIRSINISQQTTQGSILFVPLIDYENYFLRSYLESESKKVTLHQVYIGIMYRGDWRFYRSANLIGGQSLPFTEIDRSVVSCADSELTGCRVSEDFGITLNEQLFSNALENGLTFRVNSQFSNIHNTYTIPASVFKAQLTAIERLR